jgi:hypothetical protein
MFLRSRIYQRRRYRLRQKSLLQKPNPFGENALEDDMTAKRAVLLDDVQNKKNVADETLANISI